MRVSDESFANAFTRARAIQAWRHEKGLFIPVPVPVAAPPQSSRDTKARISDIWCVSTLRRSPLISEIGGKMIRLVLNYEDGDLPTHELAGDILMIGRGPSNHIVIDHEKGEQR
jgi:hypothetical protein